MRNGQGLKGRDHYTLHNGQELEGLDHYTDHNGQELEGLDHYIVHNGQELDGLDHYIAHCCDAASGAPPDSPGRTEGGRITTCMQFRQCFPGRLRGSCQQLRGQTPRNSSHPACVLCAAA